MGKVFGRFLPIAAAFAVGLAGCAGGASARLGRSGTVSLPETFRASVSVVYGPLRCGGLFEKSVSGESRLRLDSPEGMAGLELSVADGTLRAAYEGMAVEVGGSAQPPHAVLSLLCTALNTVNGVSFRMPSGGEEEESVQLVLQSEPGRMQVIVGRGTDGKNFVPSRISIESLSFEARFLP